MCSLSVLTHFNFFSLNFDRFDHEVDPDGGTLARREHPLGEPPDEAGLPHSGVSDKNDFEQKLVVLHRQTLIFCVTSMLQVSQL